MEILKTDVLFKMISNYRNQYKDGLIDKTELLANLSTLINSLVIENSKLNRDSEELKGKNGKICRCQSKNLLEGYYVTVPKK